MHREVDELMKKELVRESKYPCTIPALLVPRKYGFFRICVDSRTINKIMVDYQFPIPCLDDHLDQLHNPTILSKIDLQSGYHRIKMRPSDE